MEVKGDRRGNILEVGGVYWRYRVDRRRNILEVQGDRRGNILELQGKGGGVY